MKRLMMVLLCVCVLSASALAVDRSDFETLSEDGTIIFDEDSYNAAVAAEKIAVAGLDLDADAFWAVDWLNNRYFDNDAFEAAYSAALEKQSAESVGNSDANNAGSMEESDDKYPVGSYVDVDGNVWSSDGELLSVGSSSTAYALENDSVSSDVLDNSDEAQTTSDEATATVYNVVDMRSSFGSDVSAYSVGSSSDYVRISNTTEWIDLYVCGCAAYSDGKNIRLICNNISDVMAYVILNNSNISTVTFGSEVLEIIGSDDNRRAYISAFTTGNFVLTLYDSEGNSLRTFNVYVHLGYVPVLSGSGSSSSDMKSLISSIFGDYAPVMSTGFVTETVDNETTTTLIDVVAEGAAGVDYEWCAGVLLFAVLLFCLMKLLGGILK